MDAMYDVNDTIYVLATVKSVEEMDEDVRYELHTGLAKFFANASTDILKRNPNTEETREYYENLGMKNMFAYLYDVSQMSESLKEECFGSGIRTTDQVLAKYKDNYEGFINAFDVWYNKYYTKAGYIVKFNEFECVVLKVNYDSDNNPENYLLYDPTNVESYVAERSQFENTGKSIDIDSLLAIIAEEINNANK